MKLVVYIRHSEHARAALAVALIAGIGIGCVGMVALLLFYPGSSL